MRTTEVNVCMYVARSIAGKTRIDRMRNSLSGEECGT